jgi:hypothetical protein
LQDVESDGSKAVSGRKRRRVLKGRTPLRRRRARNGPPDSRLPAIAELAGRDQWVCWRGEARLGGKIGKVPYTPGGHRASVTDERTWSSFKDVRRAVFVDGDFNGIGFVVSEDDPYVAVDLDDCLDESGDMSGWAWEIVDAVGSYWEISPSGRGLRAFVRGSLPPFGRKGGAIEMYAAKRFVTVTGRHLPGTPRRIKKRTRALSSVHKQIFGDGSGGTGAGDSLGYEWRPWNGGLPGRVRELVAGSPSLRQRMKRPFEEIERFAQLSESEVALLWRRPSHATASTGGKSSTRSDTGGQNSGNRRRTATTRAPSSGRFETGGRGVHRPPWRLTGVELEIPSWLRPQAA